MLDAAALSEPECHVDYEKVVKSQPAENATEWLPHIGLPELLKYAASCRALCTKRREYSKLPPTPETTYFGCG